MADNDDLMLEVTASTEKADSGLKKLFGTLDEFQARIEKVTPSLSKFTEKLDSIASGSKAFAALEKLTKGTGDLSTASKKAEANEAMYQARLDRANASMARSQAQVEKLTAAKQKLAEADAIDAHNKAVFAMSPEEYARNGYDHTGKSGNDSIPVEPAEAVPDVPSMQYDSAKIQSQIDSFTSSIGSKGPKISIDTEAATAEIRKVGEYIDSLTPKVSTMSEAAQAQFNSIAAKLNLVSQRIDNQRMLYRSLADQAARTAQEQGEGSTAYLQLEKRMLTADVAAQKLSETQEELKAELADVTSAADNVGVGMTDAGNKSEKAAKKATSGFQKAAQMMEKMFLRIAAFQIFSALQQGITTGIQDMVRADNKANAAMSQLATSTLYLKNSLAAALMPAIEALTPIIVRVIDAISWAFNQIAIFTAQITGQKTVTIATKSYVDYAKSLDKAGDSAGKTSKKIKELQRTIMGFDELNVLQKNVDSAGGGGSKSDKPDYGSMFKTIPTPKLNFPDVNDALKKIKGFFDTLQDKANGAKSQFEKLTDKSAEFAKSLEKIKLPVLSPWKVPAFPKVTVPALGLGAWNKSKNKYQQPVHAPILTPATAPAIILKGFLDSRAKYQKPIAPPIFFPVIAPAIILKGFLDSKATYQAPITPPLVRPAIAPALVLTTLFIPSLQTASQKIREFSSTTQKSVSTWGANVSSNFGKTWSAVSSATGVALAGIKGKVSAHGRSTSLAFASAGNNIMKNARLTFSFIPIAVAGGLNAAGKGVSNWLTSTSRGFASFGSNIVSNVGKTMQSWYSNFVSGLSAAWNQFTGFMKGVGNNIGNWWSANKSWAAPTAAAVGLVALNVGIAVATAGTSIPAQAALAGATGLAKGTRYHVGGPALVNDAPGAAYREMVQLPTGRTFIPNGRNVFIPDLPIGSKVLSAEATKALVPHYATGIGDFGMSDFSGWYKDGGVFNAPTIAGIGEAGPEAALPLNDNVYEQIAQGIQRNSDSGGTSEEVIRLLLSIDKSIKQGHSINVRMEVDGKPFVNKVITEMENKDRRYHPVRQF